MLREYRKTDIDYLNRMILKDIYQNVYLYIDTKTYGFENDSIMTWLVEDYSGVKVVLYKYYNSLQIFEIKELAEADIIDVCNHIKNQNYEMVSGNYNIISKIHEICEKEYLLTEGYVMQGNECKSIDSNISEWAEYSDCKEIAELICSDEEIGGHYSVSLLCEQLQDRMSNWNCKNRIIRREGKIVSHMATYADVENIAVLGGLVTKFNYRGRSYGKKVLNDLLFYLKKENKIPILYCYNKDIFRWYNAQGWKVASKCAKLERIR